MDPGLQQRSQQQPVKVRRKERKNKLKLRRQKKNYLTLAFLWSIPMTTSAAPSLCIW